MNRRSFLSSTAAIAASGLATLPALAHSVDPLEAARRDPNAFVEYVSRWDRPLTQAPCHRRWQAAWNDHRSVVIGPTGFGKTTQALYRLLWEMGNNPEIEIAWIGSRPRRRLQWLHYQIAANHIVGQVFETLGNHPPRAIGEANASGADLVVIDGFFTYANQIDGRARAKTLRRIEEIESRLHRAARIMALGFPFGKGDLLFHLAAKPGWTVVHEDAIEERADGSDCTHESLDPNIMTLAEIRRKELDLGRRMAAAMLRCRPIE